MGIFEKPFYLEESFRERASSVSLVIAVGKRDIPAIKKLLKEDIFYEASKKNALILAVIKGYSEIVEVILEDKTIGEEYINVLLLQTVRETKKNKEEIIKILVKNGANIHVQNDLPLKLAADFKDKSLVQLFIDFGADAGILIE